MSRLLEEGIPGTGIHEHPVASAVRSPVVIITYGTITAVDRKVLIFPRSHANDAVVIALQSVGRRIERGAKNELLFPFLSSGPRSAPAKA